jgi:hypothetical protein
VLREFGGPQIARVRPYLLILKVRIEGRMQRSAPGKFLGRKERQRVQPRANGGHLELVGGVSKKRMPEKVSGFAVHARACYDTAALHPHPGAGHTPVVNAENACAFRHALIHDASATSSSPPITRGGKARATA